jgi:hypothetical protein
LKIPQNKTKGVSLKNKKIMGNLRDFEELERKVWRVYLERKNCNFERKRGKV